MLCLKIGEHMLMTKIYMIGELKMDVKTRVNKKRAKTIKFRAIWAQLATSSKNQSRPVLHACLALCKPAQSGFTKRPKAAFGSWNPNSCFPLENHPVSWETSKLRVEKVSF
jgi:hypothetical protein